MVYVLDLGNIKAVPPLLDFSIQIEIKCFTNPSMEWRIRLKYIYIIHTPGNQITPNFCVWS